MARVSPLRVRRGLLEVGLVVLVGALAASAVAGTGLSRTVLRTQDPLTWLRNGKTPRHTIMAWPPQCSALVGRTQPAAANEDLPWA